MGAFNWSLPAADEEEARAQDGGGTLPPALVVPVPETAGRMVVLVLPLASRCRHRG